MEKDLKQIIDKIQGIKTYVTSKIYGQEDMIDKVLIALLCNEHVLVEGLPGTGKTTTVSLISKCIDGIKLNRIQFTPDLQPTDLIGSLSIDHKGNFYHKKGKIYSHILIADEINRAPSKVQAALLEVMQERKISRIDITEQELQEAKNDSKLYEELKSLMVPNEDGIFVVFATQNPIEQEGTFPLAEASMDRFLFKIKVDYPNKDATYKIIESEISQSNPTTCDKISLNDLITLQNSVKKVNFPEKLINYVNRICRYTIEKPTKYEFDASGLYNSPIYNYLLTGVSPRAFYSVIKAARAHALLNYKTEVTISDIKRVMPDILRHRIKINFEGINLGIQPEHIIEEILSENIQI